jgi:hypothetical protein
VQPSSGITPEQYVHGLTHPLCVTEIVEKLINDYVTHPKAVCQLGQLTEIFCGSPALAQTRERERGLGQLSRCCSRASEAAEAPINSFLGS